MSYSNFVGADYPNTGLTIPSGTAGQNIVRLIANEILAVAPTVFGEVTGSSPTPAAFQSFASTITSLTGSNTYSNTSTHQHVTLYFKNDAGWAGGTSARLLRIMAMQYGVAVALLDTGSAGAAPAATATSKEWTLLWEATHNSATSLLTRASGASGAMGNTGVDDTFRGLLAHTSVDGLTAGAGYAAPLSANVSCFVWAESNWIHLRCQIKSNAYWLGEALIFTAEPPADGHWTRAQRATLFGVQFKNATASTGDSSSWQRNVAMPGAGAIYNNNRDSALWYSELGFFADYLDPSGKEFVQRIQARSLLNNEDAWHGYVPGVRLVRDSVNVPLFAEVSIDSVTWIVVQKHETWAFLVKAKT